MVPLHYKGLINRGRTAGGASVTPSSETSASADKHKPHDQYKTRNDEQLVDEGITIDNKLSVTLSNIGWSPNSLFMFIEQENCGLQALDNCSDVENVNINVRGDINTHRNNILNSPIGGICKNGDKRKKRMCSESSSTSAIDKQSNMPDANESDCMNRRGLKVFNSLSDNRKMKNCDTITKTTPKFVKKTLRQFVPSKSPIVIDLVSPSPVLVRHGIQRELGWLETEEDRELESITNSLSKQKLSKGSDFGSDNFHGIIDLLDDCDSPVMMSSDDNCKNELSNSGGNRSFSIFSFQHAFRSINMVDMIDTRTTGQHKGGNNSLNVNCDTREESGNALKYLSLSHIKSNNDRNSNNSNNSNNRDNSDNSSSNNNNSSSNSNSINSDNSDNMSSSNNNSSSSNSNSINSDSNDKSSCSNKFFLNSKEKIDLSATRCEITPVFSIKDRIVAAAMLDDPLPNGWTLFEHQKEAILKCIMNERSILAYDMGLGKTLIALVWAKSISSVMGNTLTVVISPCTLMENWKREAESIGFECSGLAELKKRKNVFKPLQITGQQSNNATSNSILSCNSDKSNSSQGLDRQPVLMIVSWQSIPKITELEALIGYDGGKRLLVIADESHAMQSSNSQRTKAALSLLLDRRCIGCVLSTGTPMKNGKPSNIYPLLVGIRHPIAKDKFEFEKRYCAAKKTRFCPWDISGASNLDELKDKLATCIIRKTKEECLDLPKISRKNLEIKADPESMVEYEKLISEIKMNKKAYSQQRNEFRHGGNNMLEMVSKLRIIASLGKVAGSARWIVEKLRGSDSSKVSPIVVFVWFKETALRLRDRIISSECRGHPITCDILTGEVDFTTRQSIVDKFQSERLNVLIATYGVGSTGLTLTKSNCVVLVDRPWSPGDLLQAEDRIRRIGQASKTIESIWVTSFELDKKLDKMLQLKDKTSQTVISDGSNRILFLETCIGNSKKGRGVNAADDEQSSAKRSDIRSFFGCSNESEYDDDFVDVEQINKSNLHQPNKEEERSLNGNDINIMRDVFNSIIQ